MTDTQNRWARLKAVFDAALDAPPGEREVLLAAAGLSADDAAELRSLLAHHDEATGEQGFLARPVSLAPPEPAAPAAQVGQRLGNWTLVRPLGAGGMGEVFEARRADGQYQGRAAVKLLKRGMDSTAVLGRFVLERQALARLNHPGIARLLDAGASAEGLPYFVMEYVDGRPIDQAAQDLALEPRLELFLQLADAVAHAHRNLLVHRDLKPGNVLVDGSGQVKLLDFGIAKALDPLEGMEGLEGDTTLGGQRPYTPHHASPEQVRGEPVSTATDIYSLGVLLYQMLTGTRPTGRRASTVAEAARSVLEDAPTRPSRLSPSEAVDPQWLRHRKRLEGDLDNILLKALEKQPALRYASVDALRADVQAHLSGHPVSARAASVGYVTAKWLGRHRAAAAAATLGGMGLVTGLVATWLNGRVALALGVGGMAAGLLLALVQARRAQLARDEVARARDAATRHLTELRRLAHSMVFEVNDALERGLIEGRRQLVHTAELSLERQAAFGPMDDAERISLGWALARLARLEGHENTNNVGNPRGALAHYDRALQVLEPLAPRQQQSADWHAAMAAALEGRYALMRQLRQADAAFAALQRAVGHASRAARLQPEALAPRRHECLLRTLLADQAYPIVRTHGLCRLAQARELAEEALACGRALAAWAPNEPAALRSLGFTLRMASGIEAVHGRLDEALALDAEALAALECGIALPGGESLRVSDFAQARIRSAMTLRAAGRYDEAHAALEPALAQAEGDMLGNGGDEHRQRQFVAVIQTLLDLCIHRGDWAGGAALYQRAQRRLPPLTAAQLADPLSRWAWQHGWMDSLQALCLARAGALDDADALTQRLRGWMAQGVLRLRSDPNPLDAELEANIHIACAQVAAASSDWHAATAAAEVVQERLLAMRALRDPADAIERVRQTQLLERLARSLQRADSACLSEVPASPPTSPAAPPSMSSPSSALR
ncbi:protein kinase [Roseateles sp. DC23W]|uniref:Protein kinase n=1 Tax=Pelomonas dachongensis TaxID=3299029 RepID=A0ABW7ERQ4_9BURK